MLYNVTIDTGTVPGRQALQDLKKYRKGVEFANPVFPLESVQVGVFGKK